VGHLHGWMRREGNHRPDVLRDALFDRHVISAFRDEPVS